METSLIKEQHPVYAGTIPIFVLYCKVVFKVTYKGHMRKGKVTMSPENEFSLDLGYNAFVFCF